MRLHADPGRGGLLTTGPGRSAAAGGTDDSARPPRHLVAPGRVSITPPLDTRDRRYWPYVIVTCALPAAVTFAVVLLRSRWAWWALAAELTSIAVLTRAWHFLRAVKRGLPRMTLPADVASARKQEWQDAAAAQSPRPPRPSSN
jgi:hypothetical protein